MSEEPAYYDINGDPTTLYRLVRNEPEWAESRLRQARKVEDERDALLVHLREGRDLVRELLVNDLTDDATYLTDWSDAEPAKKTLAYFKAQWQAEALLAAAPEMLDDRDRQRLERFASAVIRHQAEEDA